MKQIVKVIDAKTGESTVGEKTIRNGMHFEVQLRTRAHVFADKRKALYRKRKHKGADF